MVVWFAKRTIMKMKRLPTITESKDRLLDLLKVSHPKLVIDAAVYRVKDIRFIGLTVYRDITVDERIELTKGFENRIVCVCFVKRTRKPKNEL